MVLNILTFYLTLFLFASNLYAFETIKDFRGGLWETSFRSAFFLTDKNFNSDGASTGLTGGNKYQIFEFDLATRYVVSPHWALNAQLDTAMAESTGADVVRKSSALNSFAVGGELAVDIGRLLLIPEVSLLFPIEKTAKNQDTVMIGEGVSETLLKLNFQSYMGAFIGYGYLGYQVRSGGRSQLLPYSVGMNYRSPSASFGARIFGFQKASDDQDAGTNAVNERLATSNQVNGGSLFFYSMNPSVMKGEVLGLFHLNKRWSLGVSLGTTFSGANYAQGFFGEGVLIFRPSLGEALKTRSYRDLPRERKELQQKGFDEDVNDGVDQKLFDLPPKKRAKDPINDVIIEEAPEEITPRRRIIKKVDPSVSEQQQRSDVIKDDAEIKKQLNDAEMTIELKVDRKRARKRK